MRDMAVASVSAKLALRSRLVLVVAVALTGFSGALAYGATGDGTPGGRLQAFLSWSTGAEVLLLSLTTVFLATSFSRGLSDGRLVPLLTGPLPRWRVLVSWWLGVVAVLTGLVLVAQLVVGALTVVIVQTAPASHRDAMRRVLKARGVATPTPLDREVLQRNAEAEFEKLESEGGLPPGMTRESTIELLLQRGEMNRRTVRPQTLMGWTFSGIRPEPGSDVVMLRFRYLPQAAPGVLPEGKGPLGRWHVRVVGTPNWYSSPPGTWVGNEVQEVHFQSWMIEGGSEVEVQYESLEQRAVAVVFPAESVKLLYGAGGFWSNLARVGLVLLGQLVFLTALGLALAALIEGRLAILVVLFCLVVGAAHGFLLDALTPRLFGVVDAPLKAVLHTVLAIIPDLGRVDAAGSLASGELIDASAVTRSWLLDGVIRGGVCLLLGSVLFQRRELGTIR